MIEISAVSKWYSELRAVKNISLNVKEGESVLISGDNGAGKSTLLRIIAGLEKPDEGSVLFQGLDISKTSDFNTIKRDVGIGYHGAESMLYADMPIAKSFDFLSVLRDCSADRLNELSSLLDLEQVLLRTPEQCSQGMLKRAGLAQALIGEPRVLILDEPFSSLDSKGVELLTTCLNSLKQTGVTMLIASHLAIKDSLRFDKSLELESRGSR